MRQISYFLALCEEQSFTRAARRSGVAQPSFTRAIQLLEQEFGDRLFERNSATVRLTELGTLVRPDFERIDRAAADVAQKVAEFRAAPSTKVDTRTMEALMRVVAVAAITTALIIMGLSMRPTPEATAAVQREVRVQIDPYVLHVESQRDVSSQGGRPRILLKFLSDPSIG